MALLDFVPEVLATFSLFPSGLIFSHVLYLPYIETTATGLAIGEEIFYPYILAVSATLITTFLIVLLKLKQNRIIFYHFYILIIAWSNFLLAGIMFIRYSRAKEMGFFYPLQVASIATGMSTLTALNYINLRSKKESRATIIATSYLWFFLGMFTLSFIFYNNTSESEEFNRLKFSLDVGITLITISGVFFLLLIGNEVQQCCKVFYNYKECLDRDTKSADHEATLLKSSNRTFNNNMRIQIALTAFMVTTKVFGFIMFHYVFFRLGHIGTGDIFAGPSKSYVIFIFVVFGSLVSINLAKFFPPKTIFLACSTIVISTLISVSICWYKNSMHGVGYSMWIFYLATSMTYSSTTTSILEITNLRFTEISQGIGYCLEMIPIAIVQYHGMGSSIYLGSVLLHCILSGVIVGILMLVVVLYQPNTFKKSHVEIKEHLLSFRSFFMCFRQRNVNNL